MSLDFSKLKGVSKKTPSKEIKESNQEPKERVVEDESIIKKPVVEKKIVKDENPLIKGDEAFAALFDDDETDALEKARDEGAGAFTRYNSQTIDKKIEKRVHDLRKKHPMGGLKASRFLTADIMMEANREYFEEFSDVIKDAVDAVQTSIAEQQKADIIGFAQADPTNDEKQDEAFRIVQAAAVDYLDRYSTFRGVERTIIITMICNEIIGFGILDPLWRDPKVDEIICNGPKDVQVEIGGVIHQVPGCSFRDSQHLLSLIERLYSAIGKQVSRTTPIVDGRLHDNSRMAVVHTVVAPDGPNFSIRRHKEDYIPPSKLLEWGSASKELLTFVGNLIYKGSSVLVLGGTSSGKTTLLGAFTGFLRPDHRVLTLEDNLELKLAPQKLSAAPMECLPGRSDAPGSGVSMRDLVKASLRHRPNAIIVGEVRDESAYDLCQALNTGHYGMSTIHANSEYDGVYRLMSLVSQGGLMQGDATLPLIAASFDIIVRVERFPTDGSRKIVSISEVAPFPERNQSGDLHLPTRQIWKFVDEGLDDELKVLGHWEQIGKICDERRMLRRLDLERDLTWEELKEISEGSQKKFDKTLKSSIT